MLSSQDTVKIPPVRLMLRLELNTNNSLCIVLETSAAVTALQLSSRGLLLSIRMYDIMHDVDVPSVEVIFQVSEPTTPSHSQLTTVPGQVGTGGLQVRLKSANDDKLLVTASRRTQRKMLLPMLSLTK